MIHQASVLGLALALVVGWAEVRPGPAAAGTPSPPPVVKNAQALMFFGGHLEQPVLVDDAEKANQAEIVLGEIWLEGDHSDALADRDCVGMAVFTEGEWVAALADGHGPDELTPDMAADRRTFYPARGEKPAVVRTRDGEVRGVPNEMLVQALEWGVFPFSMGELKGVGCGVGG